MGHCAIGIDYISTPNSSILNSILIIIISSNKIILSVLVLSEYRFRTRFKVMIFSDKVSIRVSVGSYICLLYLLIGTNKGHSMTLLIT